MDNLKKLAAKLSFLKDKKKRLVCKNYLAVVVILLAFLVFFLCGCATKYEKAYALKAPKPVMKPVPVSAAVRMVRERETDPDTIYDDVENVFVVPPELEF